MYSYSTCFEYVPTLTFFLTFHFCHPNLRNVEFNTAFYWHLSIFPPPPTPSMCLSKKIFLVPSGIWTQDHCVTAKYSTNVLNSTCLCRVKCCSFYTYTLLLVHNSWWTYSAQNQFRVWAEQLLLFSRKNQNKAIFGHVVKINVCKTSKSSLACPLMTVAGRQVQVGHLAVDSRNYFIMFLVQNLI